ncbi:MAG: hypothetical protein JO173_02980 [Gammaproteobacteria bacterium]|nr:hypothetical protein [Gammaproteobacteria bacterium]
MALGNLVSLAEIVNAMAVSVTLIVLIVSIRHTVKAQRLLAVDTLAAAIAAINVPAIRSPAVGLSVARAIDDWAMATREERITAHYFLFSFFKLSENAWYQRQQGILDPGQWHGWETLLRKYYHSRGVREAWWPARCDAYSKKFQVFLAGTQAPAELGNLSSLFDIAARPAGPRGSPAAREPGGPGNT